MAANQVHMVSLCVSQKQKHKMDNVAVCVRARGGGEWQCPGPLWMCVEPNLMGMSYCWQIVCGHLEKNTDRRIGSAASLAECW